jgi:hypothetical protein
MGVVCLQAGQGDASAQQRPGTRARVPSRAYQTRPSTPRPLPRAALSGLLVDSARHWLPLSKLRATIDAMAANKMNVLHWWVARAPRQALQQLSMSLRTCAGMVDS